MVSLNFEIETMYFEEVSPQRMVWVRKTSLPGSGPGRSRNLGGSLGLLASPFAHPTQAGDL